MADLEPTKIAYPVKNTFIEYPAPRSFSLEEFLPESQIKSCPGSGVSQRLVSLESLEEDFPMLLQGGVANGALKTDYTIKNTFIHDPAEHPALRTTSLEEFVNDRQTKSCPGSGVMQRLESLEEEEPSVPEEFPATPSDSPIQAPATAIEFQALQGCPVIPPIASLENFLQNQPCKSFVAGSVEQVVTSDRSTAASTDGGLGGGAVTELATEPAEPALVLSLSVGLGLWSVGSAGHEVGRCKPCAFIWKNGCADGEACNFCHLCPPGEQKRRKKDKLTFRKMVRSARQGLLMGMY